MASSSDASAEARARAGEFYGVDVDAVPTPAFIVDLAKLKRNCQRAIDIAAKSGKALRPHVKTHKTVEALAHQLAPGAPRRIVVSTLAEARAFKDSVDDILYAVPIDPHKLDAVASLAAGSLKTLSILVDTHVALDAVIAAAKRLQIAKPFSVVVKVNTGYGRAGLEPNDPESLRLISRLAAQENAAFVLFAGIYSHSGHSYKHPTGDLAYIKRIAAEEDSRIGAFADHVAKELGIDVPEISVGATPSCMVGEFSRATELHLGNYIFFDVQQAEIGSCSVDEIACSVTTRVLAHYPSRGTILVDAGALALSKDLSSDGSFGKLVGFPDLELFKVSQEEGLVRCRSATRDPAAPAPAEEDQLPYDQLPVGATLRILPNHSCLTAACHPEYYVVEDGKVVDVWKPVRGW